MHRNKNGNDLEHDHISHSLSIWVNVAFAFIFCWNDWTPFGLGTMLGDSLPFINDDWIGLKMKYYIATNMSIQCMALNMLTNNGKCRWNARMINRCYWITAPVKNRGRKQVFFVWARKSHFIQHTILQSHDEYACNVTVPVNWRDEEKETDENGGEAKDDNVAR